MPVQSQNRDLQCHMSCSFLFSMILGCFVDFGGIVDYHCLNFLFIIVVINSGSEWKTVLLTILGVNNDMADIKGKKTNVIKQ